MATSVFKHCLLGDFAIPAFLLLKQEYILRRGKAGAWGGGAGAGEPGS